MPFNYKYNLEYSTFLGDPKCLLLSIRTVNSHSSTWSSVKTCQLLSLVTNKYTANRFQEVKYDQTILILLPPPVIISSTCHFAWVYSVTDNPITWLQPIGIHLTKHRESPRVVGFQSGLNDTMHNIVLVGQNTVLLEMLIRT